MGVGGLLVMLGHLLLQALPTRKVDSLLQALAQVMLGGLGPQDLVDAVLQHDLEFQLHPRIVDVYAPLI